MKATKAIEELQKLIRLHGDWEVTVYNGDIEDPAYEELFEFVCNRAPDGVITFEAS